MRLPPLAAVFALTFAFAVPAPAWAGHAGPLTAACTNPEVGYTVNFPNNWFYNTHVTGEGAAEDIEACRYFSPENFTLTPGSEPTGVAIGISVQNTAFDPSAGEQVTVGGRNAVRSETQSTTPGFEGTFYTYSIDLGGGQTLVAQTSDRWVGDYAENKQILDAMMGTLVFGAAATPTPTPAPTATPVASELADAALPGSGTAFGASALTALLAAVLAVSSVRFLVMKRR